MTDKTKTPQTDAEVAAAIGPTLELFVKETEQHIKRATDYIYDGLLENVQRYLRENAEWNIGQEIERCRQIERDNVRLSLRNFDLVTALQGVMDILGTAESNASGLPEWDSVGPKVAAARAAIAKATGQ